MGGLRAYRIAARVHPLLHVLVWRARHLENRPNYWDAWNVEIHHLEKATQLEFISLKAVSASMKLDSRSMFRFDAVVDWRKRHKSLLCEPPLRHARHSLGALADRRI
ncbi:Glycoside hydrolase family 38 protein [Mycena venus]|uniref:Glycoside hydrolase family 38 protein n=1 Tax=Mycena venus TaxID=2733690 RepID=A0A8H6X4A0_9AGAR|nr:Glycoside hydrolase family 38 protein [Mycena venus]